MADRDSAGGTVGDFRQIFFVILELRKLGQDLQQGFAWWEFHNLTPAFLPHYGVLAGKLELAGNANRLILPVSE